MNLPGFTATFSLYEPRTRYASSTIATTAQSSALSSNVLPARLAIKELPWEEQRACYMNCRNAGMTHAFCAHSCL
jgi:hypothetical protein